MDRVSDAAARVAQEGTTGPQDRMAAELVSEAEPLHVEAGLLSLLSIPDDSEAMPLDLRKAPVAGNGAHAAVPRIFAHGVLLPPDSLTVLTVSVNLGS
jgi:hypothetical protein